MRKILLAVLFCFVGVLCLAGCGSGDSEEPQTDTEETTAETTVETTEALSPEQSNENMIGVWIPAEGVENDIVSFGYMSDNGICDDPSGQLCIQVKYAKSEGGGVAPANYEVKDGKLVYTTFINEMAAGGGIDEVWTIDTETLSEGKATINDVAYEKVTDDPADNEQRAWKVFDSRLKKILSGEWKDPEGAATLKLNEDGSMHYEDSSMNVDGTWSGQSGMTVTLTYEDADSHEEVEEVYFYNVDEDYLEGWDTHTEKLVRADE